MRNFYLGRRFWVINRGLGWIYKVICIIKNQHTSKDGDWGYAVNFAKRGRKGLVDLFCPNCLQFVRKIPLDDFDKKDEILDTLEREMY